MAQVFGADLARVSVGDPAQIMTGVDGASLPGKVDNISDLVDPDTRAVAVRVVVDNPGHVLQASSMYVRVLIQAREETQRAAGAGIGGAARRREPALRVRRRSRRQLRARARDARLPRR